MNDRAYEESIGVKSPSSFRQAPTRRLLNQFRLLLGTAIVMMAAGTSSTLADHRHGTALDAARTLSPTDVPIAVSNQAVESAAWRSVSRAELERAVVRAASQHQVHPALLFAVMKAESSFNPIVVSRAGAVGLMQLIPETAMRHGVRNLYDTDENMAGGAKHLRYLLDRFHDNTRLALAAYNAGERKVDRYGKVPPYKETRLYVKKVLSYYRDFRNEGWVVPGEPIHHAGYVVRAF